MLAMEFFHFMQGFLSSGTLGFHWYQKQEYLLFCGLCGTLPNYILPQRRYSYLLFLDFTQSNYTDFL